LLGAFRHKTPAEASLTVYWLQPIENFSRYKAFDNVVTREFYSLLRTAIMGARSVQLLKILLNENPSPSSWEGCLGQTAGTMDHGPA
jgi:hypothetical protein